MPSTIPFSYGISRRHWLAAAALILLAASIELAMRRPPICPCGYVALWHGAIDEGTSQHIADWYTPSHVIHGFLFYGLTWLALRNRLSVGGRLIVAMLIEGGWELLENSPLIIDRYRSVTIALGYSGDSILNSMCDIGWMTAGFLAARRLPVRATILLALVFEGLALVTIRDDLALNVLMLVWPVEAIRTWQGGL